MTRVFKESSEASWQPSRTEASPPPYCPSPNCRMLLTLPLSSLLLPLTCLQVLPLSSLLPLTCLQVLPLSSPSLLPPTHLQDAPEAGGLQCLDEAPGQLLGLVDDKAAKADEHRRGA